MGQAEMLPLPALMGPSRPVFITSDCSFKAFCGLALASDPNAPHSTPRGQSAHRQPIPSCLPLPSLCSWPYPCLEYPLCKDSSMVGRQSSRREAQSRKDLFLKCLLHLPKLLLLPRMPTFFTWKIPLYLLRLSSGFSSSRKASLTTILLPQLGLDALSLGYSFPECV